MKTPKEKSEELVEKYYNLLSWNLQNNITKKDAIECAKIAVDEIANSLMNLSNETCDDDYVNNELYLWQEVKNELNKMS